MNTQNKFTLFTAGQGRDFLRSNSDDAKILLAYIEIIQNLCNEGCKGFVIEVKGSFNKIILEAALEVEKIHSDIKVFRLTSDGTTAQFRDEEGNSISVKKPFSRDEYILSICDKMISPSVLIVPDNKNLHFKTIKLHCLKILVYEVSLPLPNPLPMPNLLPMPNIKKCIERNNKIN